MSFEIRLKKQEGPGEGFGFPLTLNLTPEIIKGLKLEPAFRRIAEALVKQQKFLGGSDEQLRAVLGVNFTEIGFNYVIDTVAPKEQRIAERLMQ